MTLEIVPVDKAHRDAFAAIWIPWLKETMGIAPEAEKREIRSDLCAFRLLRKAHVGNS